ncbi:unnamed protein product [Didymodactylos carnosus]|uniref:Uncharacterized protein n=1 Tax=Didymodactylos carnosus TaxID=1234261 RepID=A0A813UX29_9BILA|nr:unnamed protein product [Didymodactylos carnosus]CAF1304361.1 unnamed protein product [Didymodactylos carnosus]CAF3616508.1 unnamed protein product [Didymodactylos carnosus]CAF4111101.1 unnamed protein product [Didymodactylos carnosus]
MLANNPYHVEMNEEEDEEDTILETCSPPQLLKHFFKLQNQRCQTYKQLNNGQNFFIQTNDFRWFRSLLLDITTIFNRISSEIIDIRKLFEKENHYTSIVKHMEQIQDYEKDKLQLTNELFLCRKEYEDSKKATADNKIVDYDEEMRQTDIIDKKKSQLAKLIENINDTLEELKYEYSELVENKQID